MKVQSKKLPKSQIELMVELSYEEFKPYIKIGTEKISKEVKVEGFRPGKVPYEILKQKIGEMSILEESAREAINKTIRKAIDENIEKQAVGEPKVDITKLAPNNPLEYKVVVAILPEITLGDYKNLKIKKEKAEINEEEIKRSIDYLREMRVTEKIADREIKEDDKVIVNIKMFLDKVPVEGGQSKDTAVIIGKDYLVKGFDKKLIGAKKGDKREFKLPYPSDHYQKNLAGKMVEFEVEIKEIYSRELPELNEEFAKTLGLKSIKELEENLRKNLKQEKENEAKQKTEIKMLDEIIKKSKFEEIPDVLIEHEAQTMLAEIEHGVKNQGGKFEDYLTSLKKTKEELLLDMYPNAMKRVKSALLIREIGDKEKIKATDEEVEKKVEELLKQYKGYEKVEKRVKEPAYKEYLKNTIVNQKVVAKLTEWNVVD
jgi:trigger factor